MSDVRIVAAGDAALLVQFPSIIDPAINARAVALAREIRDSDVPQVRDLVVGYSSVTVYFDPLTTDPAALEDRVRQYIDRLHEPAAAGSASIDVPVCYGAELGPDLADVAASTGLSESDVIELHSAPVYRVYVVGFVPVLLRSTLPLSSA